MSKGDSFQRDAAGCFFPIKRLPEYLSWLNPATEAETALRPVQTITVRRYSRVQRLQSLLESQGAPILILYPAYGQLRQSCDFITHQTSFNEESILMHCLHDSGKEGQLCFTLVSACCSHFGNRS